MRSCSADVQLAARFANVVQVLQREAGGQLHIGATASHYEIESSALLRQKCPLLTETAASIGDVQVRNMGTIGGSVAHADPAADYPAALAALERSEEHTSELQSQSN